MIYEYLKTCETYFPTRNQWSELPPLPIPLRYSGSVLLQSKRAYCFGGDQGNDKYVNLVESLQIPTDARWRTLPTDNKIKKTLHLAAVSLFNGIVLFGGRSYTHSVTYILNEEGEEVLSDLS